MQTQIFTHLGLEAVTLLQSQTVTLGNNGYDIDNVAQFLHHDNINRTEVVPGRVDKVEATVNARVLDITLTLSSQLLAQVR